MAFLEESGDNLSSLCTICHVQIPKYRCPRCNIQTCSLPCIKRHKIWSQCSGVRDPAAYKPKHTLATPSAFDQDFNFISGIERTIERADRDADKRGARLEEVRTAEDTKGGADGGEKRNQRKWGNKLVKGQAALFRAFEDVGVAVVKAPVGMSREKANRTHISTRGRQLLWTLEWITEDGLKLVTSGSPSQESVCSAYYYQYLTEVRRLNGEPKLKRRKLYRDVQREGGQYQGREGGEEAEAGTSVDKGGNEAGEQPQETPLAHKSEPLESKGENDASDSNLHGTQDTPKKESALSQSTDDKPKGHSQPDKPSDPEPPPNIHFYLHRPQTMSKKPVLIPISPTSSLNMILHLQIVLEFPTIYILPHPPSHLPDSYILEEEYDKKEEEENGLESNALPALRPEEEMEEVDSESGRVLGGIDLDAVDETKVLDVLKKDLGGLAALQEIYP